MKKVYRNLKSKIKIESLEKRGCISCKYSTEEPLNTCKNCIDFVHGSQIEIDFKKFKESNNSKF